MSTRATLPLHIQIVQQLGDLTAQIKTESTFVQRHAPLSPTSAEKCHGVHGSGWVITAPFGEHTLNSLI